MDRLISIVRTPGGLIKLINRPRFQLKMSYKLETKDSQLKSFYETVAVPLAATSPLVAAWNDLQAVDALGPATLAKVLRIVLETRPDDLVPDADCPPLPEEPETAVATAAHPRAYRGTLTRPPRPKAFPTTDLRPHLCSRRATRRLLERFSPVWSDGFVRAGYDVTRLPGPVHDPYMAYHFQVLGEDVPPRFAQSLLPLLRGLSWDQVLDWVAAWWSLSLERRHFLRHAVVRLVSLDRERALAWCRLLEFQPSGRRSLMCTGIVESGAWAVAPPSVEDMEPFDGLTRPGDYGSRWYHFARGLAQGLSVGYLLEGVWLADRFGFHFFVSNARRDPSFDRNAASSILDHLQRSSRFYAGIAGDVWQSGYEGFLAVLQRSDLLCLTPDAALEVYRLLAPTDLRDDEERFERWRFVRGQAVRIATEMKKTDPPYQLKFADALVDSWYFWENDLKQFRRMFPAVLALARKMCRPPFVASPCDWDLAFILLESIDSVDTLLAAPDASFLSMEKVSRRDNATWLISRGMRALVQLWKELTLRCFRTAARPLFSAAKILGTLQRPDRYGLLVHLQGHPLMKEELEGRSLSEICKTIEASCPRTAVHRVPRRLRQFLEGTRSLIPAQVEHDAALVRASLHLCRLDLIQDRAQQTLRSGLALPGASEAVLHALQMVSLADDNRRVLRRFLKAHAAGDRSYLERHPSSRRWLSQHPELDLKKWQLGIPFEAESCTYGPIRIAVEQDPLEALKMGTYVGSCLGLGGGLSYSAAATVLDVNKRVLYARDAHGEVRARQLLAVSDDGHLVCFSVYPDSAPHDVKRMFRDYDRAFAAALGISLYRSGDYTVSRIISRDWWDDFAWDFQV